MCPEVRSTEAQLNLFLLRVIKLFSPGLKLGGAEVVRSEPGAAVLML